MSEPAEAPWLSPQLLGLTALLLESHQRLFQRPLVRSNGIRLAAQELFVLDQVVLCHDGSDDPRFLYANRAALQLPQQARYMESPAHNPKHVSRGALLTQKPIRVYTSCFSSSSFNLSPSEVRSVACPLYC